MIYQGTQNYYNSDIYHYGVPGMKWGHKKAQVYIPHPRTRTSTSTISNGASMHKSSGTSVSNKKKANTSKRVSKSKNPKKTMQSGAKKAAHLVSVLGKSSIITATRMAENNRRMQAVNSFLDGDIGSAYSNKWAADKYTNIYSLF